MRLKSGEISAKLDEKKRKIKIQTHFSARERDASDIKFSNYEIDHVKFEFVIHFSLFILDFFLFILI